MKAFAFIVPDQITYLLKLAVLSVLYVVDFFFFPLTGKSTCYLDVLPVSFLHFAT